MPERQSSPGEATARPETDGERERRPADRRCGPLPRRAAPAAPGSDAAEHPPGPGAERDTTDGSAAARPAAAEADAPREQGARRVEGARPEGAAGHEDGSRPADGTGAAPAGAFAGDGPTVLTGTRVAIPSHDEQPTQEVPTTSGRSPDGTTEGSTPTTRSPATRTGTPADSVRRDHPADRDDRDDP